MCICLSKYIKKSLPKFTCFLNRWLGESPLYIWNLEENWFWKIHSIPPEYSTLTRSLACSLNIFYYYDYLISTCSLYIAIGLISIWIYLFFSQLGAFTKSTKKVKIINNKICSAVLHTHTRNHQSKPLWLGDWENMVQWVIASSITKFS